MCYHFLFGVIKSSFFELSDKMFSIIFLIALNFISGNKKTERKLIKKKMIFYHSIFYNFTKCTAMVSGRTEKTYLVY